MKQNYVVNYIVAGMVAGVFYAIAHSVNFSTAPNAHFFTMNFEFIIKCAGAGAIGGLLPGLIRQAVRGHVPLLQSWVLLVFFVFFMPIFIMIGHYWQAFLHGYMGHLLWDAYQRKLPMI